MIVRTEILYDGTLEPAQRHVDIVIDSGHISLVRASAGDCDLEAACVTPGLVNAHVHVEGSGEADLMATYFSTTPNRRMLNAVSNARKSLEAGITTVRDVGSSNHIAQDIRDAVNDGRIIGPRMRAAGAVICMTGGHGWPLGRIVDSPWEGRKAVREQLLAGADCVKVMATGGVMTPGTVPGNAQLTSQEVDAVVDEAHRHGLRAASHAIGTLGIKNALRAGVDSIEHGHMLDDECIALFKERNTYLVPTLSAPACILQHLEDGSISAEVGRKARAVNELAAGNVRRAFEAGVRIAGGSDAGTPFNFHENYAYELELMCSLLGMSPQQSLHAATATAAELIGLHRGVVQAGEPADLLLLEADVGSDIRLLRSPRVVIKDGAVV